MSSKELLNPNKFNYAFTETKLQSAKKLKEKPSFPSFQLIFKALKCVWMKYFCVVWYKKVWGPFSISSWELLMFSWWLLQSTTIASFSLRIALCVLLIIIYLFIYLFISNYYNNFLSSRYWHEESCEMQTNIGTDRTQWSSIKCMVVQYLSSASVVHVRRASLLCSVASVSYSRRMQRFGSVYKHGPCKTREKIEAVTLRANHNYRLHTLANLWVLN